MKKRTRYTLERRLTGNFDSLSDAKAWATVQIEDDMQVTQPKKLVTGQWLCIATEVSIIESYEL